MAEAAVLCQPAVARESDLCARITPVGDVPVDQADEPPDSLRIEPEGCGIGGFEGEGHGGGPPWSLPERGRPARPLVIVSWKRRAGALVKEWFCRGWAFPAPSRVHPLPEGGWEEGRGV